MTDQPNTSSADSDPSQGSYESAFDDPQFVPPKDSLLGTTLDGRFVIEEVLGQGGMSVVYKARQLRVNRYVAIKTIRLQVDTHSTVAQRFMREVETLVSLSHPNIVSVFDCVFGPGDQPYIIMDYLRGRSLEELIRDEGPLELNRFARIGVQLLSALEHAHKKGVIHRDIKPGNVMLIDDEMDFVKVVDFGLAKLTEENRKLTRSGELWGSPPYMSPEQALGESGDYRSDIYSLGAVMYEMLTGKDPFFESATVYELIKAHLEKTPPPFRHANPNLSIPATVETAINRALQKKPEERYQSVGQFQNAVIDGMSGQLNNDANEYMLRFATQVKLAGSQSSPVFNPAGSQSNPVYDLNEGNSNAMTMPDIQAPPPAVQRRHFLDSQSGTPKADESFARPMAGSNPDMPTVSRLREKQIMAEPRLAWLPWAIAACSIAFAVCLTVITLGLLNKGNQPTAGNGSPHSVRRYQAREHIQNQAGGDSAADQAQTSSTIKTSGASTTTPTVAGKTPAQTIVQTQATKQLPSRVQTEKTRSHRTKSQTGRANTSTRTNRPAVKATTGKSPGTGKPRGGSDPWDELLQMRKK